MPRNHNYGELKDPSRRAFLGTAAKAGVVLAAGGGAGLVPKTAAAQNKQPEAPPPPKVNAELDRVMTEEASPARRGTPPKYYFFGDGDHGNKKGFGAVANEDVAATWAKHGVKAAFIEKPQELQSIVDRLASGKITPAQYIKENLEMGAQNYGETDPFAPDSHLNAEANLILNCKKQGISVFAADTTGNPSGLPGTIKLEEKYVAFAQRKENLAIPQNEVKQKFTKEYAKDFDKLLTEEWPKARFDNDKQVAALAENQMKAYGPEAKGVFVYGIVHGEHKLGELPKTGAVKSTEPSIVDALGGPAKVARIALPETGPQFGNLPNWRKLQTGPNGLSADPAPQKPALDGAIKTSDASTTMSRRAFLSNPFS